MPFQLNATPPLALYIHIPWCIRKCPYCDFNSHAVRGDIPEQAYIEALIADLEQDLPGVWGRTVESIFIGGGTPSLFSPQAIERLLSEVRARTALKPAAEITLEANPGTVDQARFTGFRAAGINRLSIGIQSFQSGLLEKIGRIHDGVAARAAVAAARAAGFDNLNLDLMFGLPGQGIEQALCDLHTAMDMQPAHISWYELTIEPNTWFHHHPPQRPDDTTLWDMQAAGRDLLANGGFTRYEVSAHARPGRECRHNINYWQFGDYLGIGAGAHGKCTNTATRTIRRMTKTRHPRAYLDTAGTPQRIESVLTLTADDVILEFAMNALRLDQGFTAAGFSAVTGLPFARIERHVADAIDAGLLVEHGGSIQATPQGQRYLNDLLQYWMPATTDHARAG